MISDYDLNLIRSGTSVLNSPTFHIWLEARHLLQNSQCGCLMVNLMMTGSVERGL